MEKIEQYAKSYHAFCGADFIVSIGGKVIGELQTITWEEDFAIEPKYGYPVTGDAVFTIFDHELPLYELAQQRKEFDIHIFYASEYECYASYLISNCMLTKRAGSHSIDDAVVNEKYFFRAKKIEKLTGEEAVQARKLLLAKEVK